MGTFGGIVVNGPSSAAYDVDLGTYLVNDYYHRTVFQESLILDADLQKGQPPPPADNILVNGTNKNPQNGGGSYGKVTITKGKKYRLRLVNSSVDNALRVSLDGHNMTVISADFTAIEPYTTNWVLLAIGKHRDL